MGERIPPPIVPPDEPEEGLPASWAPRLAEAPRACEPVWTLDRPPRSGDLCPRCQAGHLDYDGLLNLVCLHCGYTVGGSFT